MKRRNFISMVGLGGLYVASLGLPERFDIYRAAALVRQGGVLRIPAGRHVLTRTLVLPYWSRIVGAGSGRTVLAWRGPGGDPMIRFLGPPNGMESFTMERSFRA